MSLLGVVSIPRSRRYNGPLLPARANTSVPRADVVADFFMSFGATVSGECARREMLLCGTAYCTCTRMYRALVTALTGSTPATPGGAPRQAGPACAGRGAAAVPGTVVDQ
jgi:hypothetical protein